mgnify:CR=1 FL=1
MKNLDSLNIDFFDRQKPIKNAETDFEKKTGFKKVNVLYGNSIFEAAFNLDTKSGMVEMVDDEPVSNNLTTQTFRFNDFSGKKIEKKQKSFLKEKISRHKPVVFIRKNIYVFSFILLFSLSLLFGFWNIKKYEIYDTIGSTVDENIKEDIYKYFNENCASIENKAKNLYAKQDFEQAISLLQSIPETGNNCFQGVPPLRIFV